MRIDTNLTRRERRSWVFRKWGRRVSHTEPRNCEQRSSWLGDCSLDNMLSRTDATISENARILAIRSRGSSAGKASAHRKQRAEGDFLRKLVVELQPMLRESMRSHRIFLTRDALGAVVLKSDGLFVHVDGADHEASVDPVEVLSAEPNLLTIIDHIEAELVAADDPRAMSAADVVRFARYSLAAAAAA